MFPEEAIHCVEWARDQFGKKFTQLPKAINKRIEEAKNGEDKTVLLIGRYNFDGKNLGKLEDFFSWENGKVISKEEI